MKTSSKEEKLLNRVTELEKELAIAKKKIEALDITERKKPEQVLEKRLVALTRPLDNIESLSFSDLFNLNDIQKIQDDFANATGVASIITQVDGTPITRPSNFCRLCNDIIRRTEKGYINCCKSDAEIGKIHPDGPIVQPCMSGGLWDAGAGISVGGKHVANWLIGQVRDESQTEEAMIEYANSIGADEKEFLDAFNEVPSMSQEKFHNIANAVFTLASNLSFMAYQNVQQARFITEREQAEQDLKESEEKFRALYNNAPLSYQSLNEDGSFNDVNPAWLNTLGYKREEVIGKFYRDFIHPESRTHFDKNFPAFKKRGYVHDVQFKIRHKKGHYLDISFEGRVGYNPDGSFKQTYCVFQDITERKQAEEALKESEQLFSQMFEQSIVSTQLLDLQGNTIRVNPQFCKLFGVTKEDMMHYKIFEDDAIKESDAYTPLRDVFENKNAHKWFNQFNIALASECSGVKTNRPETIFLENLSYPILDNEVNLQYVVIQHHDITERKKAEQNLKENRYYLAKAQEIGNIGTWKLDLINNELIWTEQNYLNFGIPIGTRLTYEIFLECIHPDDRDYVNEEWMAALDGKPYDIEHRIIVDSKVRWVREKADVEFDDNNRAISAIGFTQDITQRKQTEEALVESQRLGAIGEMTSAVAHDFNNSLQTIFGNLELALLNPDIPGRVRQYLEVVKEASGDAAARVQLLQRFGGKQQGKSQRFPINMNKIINEVINQSRPLWKNEAEKKGLEITIETNYREIPKIAGNDGELRSVVYNIIKNAVEAMPDGGVITIETGEESGGVFIRITDSGNGMDEETRARIFQPFYSTKGFELGRGLGMSGAYTILHEHQGNIKVKATAPGKGTTIELILPVSEGEEISEDKEPVAGSEGIAKILWVDDDKAICELAKEILDCLGHEGDVAGSGKKALEYLAIKTYDLVITDLGMPGMTGWQLADEIKKIYKEKIKVAVVTGWGFQVSEEEMVAHGVGYVLGKPVKLKDVESLIGEVMQVR